MYPVRSFSIMVYATCLQVDSGFEPLQTANGLSAFIEKLNAVVSRVFSFPNLTLCRFTDEQFVSG